MWAQKKNKHSKAFVTNFYDDSGPKSDHDGEDAFDDLVAYVRDIHESKNNNEQSGNNLDEDPEVVNLF